MEKFQKKIFKEVDDNGNVIQHFAIVLYKDNCGPVPIALPTPFSSFLLKYKGKKATSIDKAASCIVPFLNYLFYEGPSKIKNIENLTLQHGIDYLSSLICAKKTQNDIATHLTKFYFFLAKENRLPLVNDVFIINKDSIGREYIANIFEGKYQVTHKQQVDSIHEIKLEYLPLFLQCVKQNNFDIYLGVLFQFCGGLRISEVVSLEYSNVRHARYWLFLMLQCNLAWRLSDILSIPALPLIDIEKYNMKWFEENEFTLEVAQIIVETAKDHIEQYLVQKTGVRKHFIIANSFMIGIAIGFIICEQFRRSINANDLFNNIEIKYTQLVSTMDKDIEGFSNLKACRSLLSFANEVGTQTLEGNANLVVLVD